MSEKYELFYRDLAELLAKYQAEIAATDDGQPYGMALPLIEVMFTNPYRRDEFAYLDHMTKPPVSAGGE